MSGPDQGATRTGLYAAAELVAGERVAGRYRIEGLLGVGGMGLVYRAHDEALDVPVALKLLRPEFAQRADAFERFRQEILLARQVSSPRVVRIHDIAEHAGRWLISMDLVEGESLDRLLEREGSLPVEQVIAIAQDLAEALSAAHASGVVHRDLKPGNVLLDNAGRARISDFGVARSLGTSGATQSGMVVGTPDYLAPEQARGGYVDGRADLYALGLILYEMLGGRRPFDAGTVAESLGQRLVSTPPPIQGLRPETPPWLARLVMRLLRTAPAQRLADADAVQRALQRRALPRQWRLPRPPLWALPVLLLVLAAAWLGGRQVLRGAPTVSVPERLMVVASGGPAAQPALAEAVAEHLRKALLLQGQVAVADAERTRIAQAQIGIGVLGTPDRGRLRELPAREVLHIEQRFESGLHRFDALLLGPQGELQVTGPALAEPLPAARGLLQALSARSGRVAGIPDLFPEQGAALAGFAEALAEREAGRVEAAAQRFGDLAQAHPEYALARWAQIEARLTAGHRRQALEALRAATPAAGSALALRLGMLREALEGEDGALEKALQARVARLPGDLSARLAQVELAIDRGDFDRAAEIAAEVSRRDPLDPGAWFLLGKATLMRGDPQRAVEDPLLRALLGYKRARNLRGEAETSNAMGVGYARLGQIGDAEEQYRKGMELRRSLGDRRGTAASLHNLAQLALLRSKLDTAEELLAEAGQLFDGIGDHSGSAAVENERGLLFEERGNFPQALEAYRRALRSRQLGNDAHGIAESLNNLGYAHFQLGDYDNADALWRQALSAFTEVDDRSGQIRVQQNLGLLDVARGDWERAEQVLSESLAEAERRQLFEEAAVSDRNLAELALLQGRPRQALRRLESARRLFAERGDRRGLLDAQLLGARARAAIDGAAAALAELEPLRAELAEASLEQQALAALLQAAQIDTDDAAASQALQMASELVERAGIERLRLEVAVQRYGRGDRRQSAGEIAGAVLALGNLPLTLHWLETRMSSALAESDPSAAADTYAQALPLLRPRPDYARAAQLHRLGAQALSALGRSAEAGRALAAAQAAPTEEPR